MWLCIQDQVYFILLNIIDKIKYVKEDWLLKSLEKLLSDVELDEALVSDNQKVNPDYSHYVGNIEDHVDLEKIKKERPLKELNMVEFEEMANSLEWD